MPDGSGIDVNSIIAQALAQSKASDPQSAQDAPIIPLWKVRPANSAAAGPTGPTGPLAGNVNPMLLVPKAGGTAGSSAAADHAIETAGGDYSTMAMAEGHWLDMTDQDRMDFAAEAEKAGLWKKGQGGDALFAAWAKAVGWAGKYNTMNSEDKSKWISPFEAASKMQIAGMADDNQSHDGFSTQTSIQQFSQSQLMGQARSVLQQELGRNPTDSEMRAYTAAVNAAARANPQTVTQNAIKNGDGSTTSDQLVTGGFSAGDATDVIQGMAQDTQESKDYKAAAMYLPALQQALTSFAHL